MVADSGPSGTECWLFWGGVWFFGCMLHAVRNSKTDARTLSIPVE